jgi:hypothetical protein
VSPATRQYSFGMCGHCSLHVYSVITANTQPRYGHFVLITCGVQVVWCEMNSFKLNVHLQFF